MDHYSCYFKLTVNFLVFNRSQKHAYKLVNGLHGWVCLGLHCVEDSPASFLSENIYRKSVSDGMYHNQLS